MTWIEMWKDIGARSLSSRARAHYPVGFATACLAIAPAIITGNLAISIGCCVAAVIFAGMFAFYEQNEDEHLKDAAHKDLIGFNIGFAAGIAACVALYVQDGSVPSLVESTKDSLLSLVTKKNGGLAGIAGMAGYLIKSFLENRKKLLEKKEKE